MSYDISIGQMLRHLTSNGNQIYRDHLDDQGLKALNGMTGKEASVAISSFFDSFRESEIKNGPIAPSPIERYNVNGGKNWTAMHLTFMFHLYVECLKYPEDIVSVQ